MKITCEACGARYAISDDKVRGRRLRIRCKRCDARVSVRGDLLASGRTSGEALALAMKVEAHHPVGAGEVPAPRATGAPLSGQRNDNSVLFSSALLGGMGAPQVATASVGGGSGLIDIGALAHASGPPRDVESPARPDLSSLLSVGSAPVMAPTRAKPSRGLLWLGLIALGLSLLALASALVLLFADVDDPRRAPVTAVPSGGPSLTEPSPFPSVESGAQGEAERPLPAPNDVAADAPATPTTDRATDAPQRGRAWRRHSARARTPQPTAPTAPAPEPVADDRSIARLLEQADRRTSEEGVVRTAPARLETPSRREVARALRGQASAVSRCAAGQHGVVEVQLTVTGQTGRVSNARVTGAFESTSAGSCVTRAMRGVQFRPFRRRTFSVRFPYRV